MFLDIGLGIIIPALLSKIFHFELTNTYILFGILFSLLPDIDFIWYKIFSGKNKHVQDHKHRDILHYPILYLIFGVILFYFLNIHLLVLFLVCSFFHFMHDSIGIGWGIQWFFPFKKNYYQFLYTTNKNYDRSLVYSYKPEDLDAISETYGDKEWFRNIYLKLHPYSIIEFLVFVVSIIILIFIK